MDGKPLSDAEVCLRAWVQGNQILLHGLNDLLREKALPLFEVAGPRPPFEQLRQCQDDLEDAWKRIRQRRSLPVSPRPNFAICTGVETNDSGRQAPAMFDFGWWADPASESPQSPWVQLSKMGWPGRDAEAVRQFQTDYIEHWRRRLEALAAQHSEQADESKDRLPPDHPYCFELAGEYWHVRFGDERGDYRKEKGFQYLADLLRRPGRLISAEELQGAPGRETIKAEHTHQTAMDTEGLRNVYNRLQQAKADREKARHDGEVALANELDREIAGLLEQVRATTSLGRDQSEELTPDLLPRLKKRRLGAAAPAKKAWDAVRKALERAYAKLAPKMPRLVEHLKKTITGDGTSYVYHPAYDPAHPSPAWKI